MKKFLLIVLLLAVLAAALVFYLKATTPATSAGVRFPLTPSQQQLLESVPASAEAFALIPSAAVFRAKLVANPITRQPVMEWIESQQLPRSWMLGGADLVIWRAGKQTSYAVHLDPLRAAIVRTYVMLGSGIDEHVSAGTFIINARAGQSLGAAGISQLLSVANGLPPADAIIVQRSGSRGSFPPVGRPAVTMVQIGTNDLVLTSRAGVEAPVSSPAPVVPALQRPRFPRGALVAATFHDPPRVVADLDRLFIARVSHLLDDGGSIVLYDVNAGTLLPRPHGLIVANATPDNRKTAEKISRAVETFGEIRQSQQQILLSFDKNSMMSYSTDTFVEAQWPSNDWAARVDPRRAVPLLEKLGDNAGLRLAAPRIYRSARDLRRWIGSLSAAESIEASHSVTPTAEEMRVRIASK